MLDIALLTGKQRQVVQHLQTRCSVVLSHLPSLRDFCQQHELDFNFVKGFLLGGALDEYVQTQALSDGAWVLTAKGQSGDIPGFALADKLLQGMTQIEELQAELGQAFSLNYGALRKENAVDMETRDGMRAIAILAPQVLENFRQRQAALRSISNA
jgi:phenylalanyl-tRNA synthetase alpha chain